MAEPRIKMAYDAAVNQLASQSKEFAMIRNRAIVILGIETLAATLFASVGRLTIQPSHWSPALPTWAVWVLLGMLVVIDALILLIMIPPRDWQEVPPPEAILEQHKLGVSEDELLTTMTVRLSNSYSQGNKKSLGCRLVLLHTAVVLLILQIAILLIAIAR